MQMKATISRSRDQGDAGLPNAGDRVDEQRAWTDVAWRLPAEVGTTRA